MLTQSFLIDLLFALGVAIGIGFLRLLHFSYCLYRYLRKRRDRIVKEKLLKQIGGLRLQRNFSLYGRDRRATIFSEEDLQSTTNNYSRSQFLGLGGLSTVYKGMLPDGTIVAVKRSKTIGRGQTEHSINEVVVLSQDKHCSLSREDWYRIACDVTGAVAYMHSAAASIPI